MLCSSLGINGNHFQSKVVRRRVVRDVLHDRLTHEREELSIVNDNGEEAAILTSDVGLDADVVSAVASFLTLCEESH